MKPLSSNYTILILCSRAFFDPVPIAVAPLFNGGFISLTGPALRLLSAPAEVMQDVPDMARMALGPKLVFNDLGDPRQGL